MANCWSGGGGAGQQDGKAIMTLVYMWRDNKVGLFSARPSRIPHRIPHRSFRMLYANP